MSSIQNINSSHGNGNEAIVYKTYKVRYLGLFTIVFLNIASGFIWLTYSSVTEAAQAYLNCTSTFINLTSMLYFVAFVIMAPLAGWMFEAQGIRRSLLFGSLLQLIGAWLRYFSNWVESTPEHPGGRLALTMIGHIIAALSQPFFLSLPAKFAATWFSDKSRTTAVMIGSISNAVAAALAMLIIPVITTDAATMSYSVLLSAILATVGSIPVLFVPERPPTPPSPSAALALRETAEAPFWATLRHVCSDLQFICLMFVFGTMVATFSSLMSLLNQITEPFGYSAADAGYFGAAMIVAGLVSAGVISPWADRHRHHVKLLCKILIPTAVVLLIGFMFSIRRNAFVPLIVFSALLGAVAFSMLGIGVELGVEVTYPATPASTSAILWAFAQLLSALFILILESLLNLNQDMSVNRSTLNPPLIFLIVWCVVFGVIPVMLIQAPYRRMEAEDKMRQEMEAASMPEQGAGQLRDVERGIEMSSTESSRSKSGDKEELV